MIQLQQVAANLVLQVT